MLLFARFQAINENDKASVVRKVMQNSTPNFDFFYLTALSTLMATFGLIENNVAIVIGSMLIAPVLYPILGLALGLVMSDISVWTRSSTTLIKALVIGLVVSSLATILFAESAQFGSEILLRTETTVISFMIAVIAGLAVTYALAQPEWSETLPGVAISVALIPPLATIGIGIAWLNFEVLAGASLLLGLNIFGIVTAAMISFSLMNLGAKKNIAESTIKREKERMDEEKDAIKEIENKSKPAE